MKQVWGKVIVDDGVLPKRALMISAFVYGVKIYICVCVCLRQSGSLQEERMY